METLKELPQRQAILDLERKNAKLKEEVKLLKEELEDERKANSVAATKLGKSLELVRRRLPSAPMYSTYTTRMRSCFR